ncbi:SDR family oxidoreductase [Vagococcus sp. BWB3-3]|uniref:SDR family oxidoreductase n=1 Tax=Vagococcus allomyrinae TaxID=2794353 RepID=A0A940SVI6_9ENTE|nr:SDR family oxidoreductase [Vagococcus allomyrinae]MBP1041111.1 SDR family oxidoreductase [Vagococcus allomyrinae]
MKYALILGASGDIGQACAQSLAASGWSLYCHYHQQAEKVKNLTKVLEKEYPKQDFFSLQFDMRQEELPTLVAPLFQVDAIVFASGGTIYKLLTETSSEEMEQLWQVSLKTPMRLCQQLQPKLAQSKQGRIVFVGSVYGSAGSAMEVVYSTLKGGQEAFAKAYAQEVATLGITVNVVAPGAVNTQMNQEWTREERAELVSDIPLRRLAEPEEIADLVDFLVSEKSAYITGTTIPISGGWKV